MGAVDLREIGKGKLSSSTQDVRCNTIRFKKMHHNPISWHTKNFQFGVIHITLKKLRGEDSRAVINSVGWRKQTVLY